MKTKTDFSQKNKFAFTKLPESENQLLWIIKTGFDWNLKQITKSMDLFEFFYFF